MNLEECQKFIASNVKVPRQKLTVAKAYILQEFQCDTKSLIDSYLESVGAELPDKVVAASSVVRYSPIVGQIWG